MCCTTIFPHGQISREADILTEGLEDAAGFGLFRFPLQVEVRAGIRVNLTVGEHVPGRGQ